MDLEPIIYGILSVVVVSLISLVGSIFFLLKTKNLNRIVLYLISLSVGALLGDVFIHILPEAFEGNDTTIIGLFILAGIVFSFIIEKIIHYKHRHLHDKDHSHKEHPHAFAVMNLLGDVVHNFIDGIIIATSYLISIPVGIATTIAVIMHEIPQEIGDMGVLIAGGFSKTKAIMLNLLTAFAAVVGTIIGFLLASSETLLMLLIPFSAGNLLYIAASDLIPQLHKTVHEEKSLKITIVQVIFMLIGIGVLIILAILFLVFRRKR